MKNETAKLLAIGKCVKKRLQKALVKELFSLHNLEMVNESNWMFGICLRLQVYQQLREELAKAKTLEGIADVNRDLKLRCQVTTWALTAGITLTLLGGNLLVSHALDLRSCSLGTL